MPGAAPAPEIRTFNNTVTVTALTMRRKRSWTFAGGDQITNIKRIGGRVRFDAGENVAVQGTFELDWIAFELATKEKQGEPKERLVGTEPLIQPSV